MFGSPPLPNSPFISNFQALENNYGKRKSLRIGRARVRTKSRSPVNRNSSTASREIQAPPKGNGESMWFWWKGTQSAVTSVLWWHVNPSAPYIRRATSAPRSRIRSSRS